MPEEVVEELVTPGARQGAFQNPQLLARLEEQLGTLVGQSSDYIASLPANVRRRMNALKNLQQKDREVEAEFEKQVRELEKQFLVKHNELYNQRLQIVSGDYEPNEEEANVEDNLPPAPPSDESIKGIPEFWATALKNLPPLRDSIKPEDDDALKHLTDIRYRYLDDQPGFALDFYFSPNDYFTNEVLTKTYYLEYSPESFDEVYDHAEGTTINWKEGKDLSVRVEIKKQRNKTSNKTRTVKKTVPAETFFNFFSPPQPPSPDEEDELDEEDFATFEMDYEVGEMIKERLIPHAVNWFTGEALEDFNDEDEYDEYDDDDEDDDDDDDEGEGPAGAVDKAPECKQQ